MCDHLLCEFISESSREYSFDLGRDKHPLPAHTHCYIREPAPMTPKHYMPDTDEHAAIAWLSEVDPAVLRRELDRFKMTRAARGLAKFLGTEPGNHAKLLQSADDTMHERLAQLGVSPQAGKR